MQRAASLTVFAAGSRAMRDAASHVRRAGDRLVAINGVPIRSTGASGSSLKAAVDELGQVVARA